MERFPISLYFILLACILAPLLKTAPGNFVEPTFEAWEASVLPLNYTRKTND